MNAVATITTPNAALRSTILSASPPIGSPNTSTPPAIEAQFAATDDSALTEIAPPI
jgi:hypothetical protein